MPRDYAKRSQTNSKRPERKPARAPSRKPVARRPITPQARMRHVARRKPKRVVPWRQLSLLLLIAVSLTLGILALRYFAFKINHATETGAPVRDAIPVATTPPPSSAVSETVIAPADFIFEPNPQTHTDTNKSYALQLGVYSTGDDMTVLKNKLDKYKIAYRYIQRGQPQEVSYRIVVGPFANELAAAKTQQLLRKHRIFSVLTVN